MEWFSGCLCHIFAVDQHSFSIYFSKMYFIHPSFASLFLHKYSGTKVLSVASFYFLFHRIEFPGAILLFMLRIESFCWKNNSGLIVDNDISLLLAFCPKFGMTGCQSVAKNSSVLLQLWIKKKKVCFESLVGRMMLYSSGRSTMLLLITRCHSVWSV